MQLLKNELKTARDILDKISLKIDRGAMFFDIDVSEDVENSDSLIILTETTKKKNVGYTGLTRLGLVKFANHYDKDLSAPVPFAISTPIIISPFCHNASLLKLYMLCSIQSVGNKAFELSFGNSAR